MIHVNGKHNRAIVFAKDIDDTTHDQLLDMCNHPALKGNPFKIMPDCHAGNGSCIGFTFELDQYVIPNMVGVDIGCGVLSLNTGLQLIDGLIYPPLRSDSEKSTAFALPSLDKAIRKAIPLGFSVRSDTHAELKNPLFQDDIHSAVMLSHKMGIDSSRVLKSLGTLGGGNHFIELGVDPADNVWVTIHTGSRNFGLKVAKLHTDRAKKLNEDMFSDIPAGYNFLPMKSFGMSYLADMEVAQRFAQLNRHFIMLDIMKVLELEIDGQPYEQIESVHNYIELGTTMMVRKGAISAKTNERVLIPFNQRDGIAVGTGKGNSAWNFSAPHGAGRLLSRSKAKKTLSMEKYTAQMEGIHSTSVVPETLDEAPDAYKDMETILTAIRPTVSVDFLIKPILNIKDKSKKKGKK